MKSFLAFILFSNFLLALDSSTDDCSSTEEISEDENLEEAKFWHPQILKKFAFLNKKDFEGDFELLMWNHNSMIHGNVSYKNLHTGGISIYFKPSEFHSLSKIVLNIISNPGKSDIFSCDSNTNILKEEFDIVLSSILKYQPEQESFYGEQ